MKSECLKTHNEALSTQWDRLDNPSARKVLQRARRTHGATAAPFEKMKKYVEVCRKNIWKCKETNTG